MKDFYEELNLSNTASTSELYDQLIALQRTWVQRQINSPDKAAEKLLVINEALKVFENDAARQSYDDELIKSKNPPQTDTQSVDTDRIKKVIHYRGESRQYLLDGKYDLAKVAIDNALKYYNPTTDQEYFPEYTFIGYTAQIYLAAGDLQGALRYNNEAIVICPESDGEEWASNYSVRSDIFFRLFLERGQELENTGYGNPYTDSQVNEWYREALDAARKAYSKINLIPDKNVQIEDILNLAEILSLTNEKSEAAPQAFAEARELAQTAIRMGDTSGRAQSVLNDCQESSIQTFQPYQGGNHPSVKSSNNGCYIATAVYGTYDCPEVWVLRRFRDYRLRATWCGRLFIKIYYALSPIFVRLFGKTAWFNSFFRKKLNRLVFNLKLQGYSCDTYHDGK